MPSSQCEGRERLESAKSRLGEALLRLQSSLEKTRGQENRFNATLNLWQQKWSSRREQIRRRLAAIESHLEQFSEPAESAPQLSLVVGAGDRQR